MRKIGEAPGSLEATYTCQCRGRMLSLSQGDWKLVVTEVILGERAKCVTVATGVDCKTTIGYCIASCSFGCRILVMSGRKSDVFAALVAVDKGRLVHRRFTLRLLR